MVVFFGLFFVRIFAALATKPALAVTVASKSAADSDDEKPLSATVAKSSASKAVSKHFDSDDDDKPLSAVVVPKKKAEKRPVDDSDDDKPISAAAKVKKEKDSSEKKKKKVMYWIVCIDKLYVFRKRSDLAYKQSLLYDAVLSLFHF